MTLLDNQLTEHFILRNKFAYTEKASDLNF